MSGSHIEHDVPTGNDPLHRPSVEIAAADASGVSDHEADPRSMSDTMMATVATVGVVGVAAVVLEAALIPGMVLGVAAALAPSYVPRLGSAFGPLFRSGMRGAYKFGNKTREMMSEAREHMNDIAAEVAAEGDAPAVAASKSKPNATSA